MLKIEETNKLYFEILIWIRYLMFCVVVSFDQVRFHPLAGNHLFSAGLDQLICSFVFEINKLIEDDTLTNGTKQFLIFLYHTH
jgi:hypothetical protein